MKRLLVIGVLLGLAACTQEAGERCNPMRATSDCNPGLTCVFPSGPTCGVSFCCVVDDGGNITDNHPSCQPNDASVIACMQDLSVAPGDGGTD